MKIICEILALVLLGSIHLSAQITNEGSLEIEAGSSLEVKGVLTNKATSTILNNGEIDFQDDLVNEAGGVLNGSLSAVYKFSGAQNSQVTLSGDTLENVSLNKDAGFNIILQDLMRVTKDLAFISNQNKVILGDHSLYMLDANGLMGYDSEDYVQADGLGSLRLPYEALMASDFPVGDASNYSKINIDLEGGTPASGDYIEVRVVDAKHPQLRAEAVDNISRYWIVGQSGISGYDAKAVGSYVDGDIVGTETNIKGTAYETVRGWTQKNQEGDDITNTITVSLEKSNEEITGGNTLGIYDIKFFMQGPYSTSGDTLKSDLNKDTTGAIVNILEVNGLKCPYDTSISVATNFFIDHPNIVDWILVEFRDDADSVVVLDSIFGFVDKNGSLLDISGSENIVRVNADKAWVVIKHRNHLGITTSTAVDLDEVGNVVYDFTTSMTKAWDNVSLGNDQMKELEAGVFGMIRGDANGNGKNNVSDLIKSKIAAEPNQANIYLTEDVNLNGLTNVADIVQTKINASPNQEQHVPK